MKEFNIPFFTEALVEPERIVFPPSWVGHLPFASWIILLLKPKVLVELGTHSGNSYSAFCQSIKNNNLDTTAYAVDAWRGKTRSMKYGEEVYTEYQAYHKERYSEFSTLLRMPFDEAVHQFEDHSIDLLHIDGFYTYEAVKHDFETWLPKLSSRAVILFHNTYVYERNFGVYQLWNELTERYPGFSFTHSHGLGVLLVGKEVNKTLHSWCNKDDFKTPASFFEKLGDYYKNKFSLNEKENLIEIQKNLLIESEASLVRKKARIKELEGRIIHKYKQLLEKENQLNVEKIQGAKKGAKIIKQQNLLAYKDSQIIDNSLKVNELDRYFNEQKKLLENIQKSFLLLCIFNAAKKFFKKNIGQLQKYKLSSVIFLKHIKSDVFDARWYLENNSDVRDARLNPFLHFLCHGMYQGRSPNGIFNSSIYFNNNQDVQSCGIPPVLHFLQWGYREKRVISTEDVLEKKRHAYSTIKEFFKNTLSTKHEKIILAVGHEATQTGAPIILLEVIKNLAAHHNCKCIAVLMRGGELVSDYQNICPTLILDEIPILDNNTCFELISECFSSFKEKTTCLFNTVCTKDALTIFGEKDFKSISIIHEMPASINKWFGGSDTIKAFEHYSNYIILPSKLTYDQIVQAYHISNKKLNIIHYGLTLSSLVQQKPQWKQFIYKKLNLQENTSLVLGCGSYVPRKGFDLFLEIGKKVINNCKKTKQPIPTFLWVGTYLNEDYAIEQISNLEENLKHHFIFLDAQLNAQSFIAAADVFVLPSREDPCPLVALEAASYDVPIVLFSKATGIEDVLPFTSYYSTEQFNIELIASSVLKALKQEGFKGCSDLARKEFSWERYANEINTKIESLHKQDLNESLPASEEIHAWSCSYGKKPLPGFHPGIYCEDNKIDHLSIDPFIDYSQKKQPAGRWKANLIVNELNRENEISQKLRIGLHIHVFYPDLLEDIIIRLMKNQLRPDLLITVPSFIPSDLVLKAVEKYPKKVKIVTVENKGRDIGAFLTAFGRLIMTDYDIIGHVHTKKSIHVDNSIAEQWREFLLDNLLGGGLPMADIIVGEIARKENLGLVFPDDPYTNGWDKNRAIGQELLFKMGIEEFHEQFNFPIGNMFWAKTKALTPLFNLDLEWEDYPEEPIPIDGTILHALERVIPFVVEKEGYKTMMTHVDGVTR